MAVDQSCIDEQAVINLLSTDLQILQRLTEVLLVCVYMDRHIAEGRV